MKAISALAIWTDRKLLKKSKIGFWKMSVASRRGTVRDGTLISVGAFATQSGAPTPALPAPRRQEFLGRRINLVGY